MVEWNSLTTKIILILFLALISYLMMRVAIWWAVKRSLVKTMHDRPQVDIKKREEALNRLFHTTCGLIIIVIAIFLVLAELRINIAALVGAFGAVAITVGFATRNLVGDLIAGAIIAIENQYNVGDVIKVADITGMVEAMNLRKTALRDLDSAIHYISNREIRPVMNLSKMSSITNMDINISHKEDITRVMSTIRMIWEEIAGDPKWGPSLISKKPWLIRVDDPEAQRVVIRVVGETQPRKQGELTDELRRRIRKVFDEKQTELGWHYPKPYFGKN